MKEPAESIISDAKFDEYLNDCGLNTGMNLCLHYSLNTQKCSEISDFYASGIGGLCSVGVN
jgi:aminoglycoside N3'-acetyltransferase